MFIFSLFSYSAIQLFSYSAIQLFSYSAIQLFSYSAIQLFSYSAIQLFSYSAIQRISYLVFMYCLSYFWLIAIFRTFSLLIPRNGRYHHDLIPDQHLLYDVPTSW
ncbi:hypothetical protein DT816_08310 [Salmonella enterica]|nr:hypothetical protein [Salmonella enterica]